MELIEVGFFASRNPDGSFNDPIPLYVEATAETKDNEREMLNGLGRELARIYDVEKMANITVE